MPMESRSQNSEEEKKTITKDEVITKLKDDGDFDNLRLSIIRKLKDNEDLRSSIVSIVRQSVALNRAGAENMKPRQLSDAIYDEVGGELMSKLSDGVWGIIRSDDGMKNEIMETVQSVYNKLAEPGKKELGEPSTNRLVLVENKDKSDNKDSVEPQEPPGFSLSSNQQNHQEPILHTGGTIPGFCAKTDYEQPDDGSDEDPEVPPGFG